LRAWCHAFPSLFPLLNPLRCRTHEAREGCEMAVRVREHQAFDVALALGERVAKAG